MTAKNQNAIWAKAAQMLLEIPRFRRQSNRATEAQANELVNRDTTHANAPHWC